MAAPAPEAQLFALYRDVVRRLVSLAAAARGGASEPFIRAQLAEISRRLSRLNRVQSAWVAKNVPAHYRLAVAEAQTSVERLAKQGRRTGTGGRARVLAGGFTGADGVAMASLAIRVSEDLGAIRTGLEVGLALNNPKQAAREVQAALDGENKLVQLSDGRVSVKVPSGKFWSPDVYSRMVGRTVLADARRVAFRERYLSNGIDKVKVVDNGSSHSVCEVWEGQTLSLTGADGLPTPADARAAGLFHPNCRHRYVVDTDAEQPGIPLGGSLPVAGPDAPLPILGVQARIPAPNVPTPTL